MEKQYFNLKDKLLNDKKVVEKNRKLFKKFLEYEEYKLKRKNGLPKLDNSSYKTLCAYCSKLRTVNNWFKNK